MNDTRSDGARPQQVGERGRLDSWKKIATHFNRDVTTVQRWERREGMPVHRHVHDKQGSVYAFRSELDAWWESRRGKLPDSDDSAPAPFLTPPPAHSPPSPNVPAEGGAGLEVRATGFMRMIKPRFGWAASITAVLLLVYAAFRLGYPGGETWRNPLANATFTRLTDWPGIEQAAEISRDGRWVSFLADHDGHMDAWLTQIGSGSYRNLTRGERIELVNPSIRTLGFSADGSLVTVWTRSSDGSHSEDIKVMATPIAGGELRDFLGGIAEVAWSHDGRQIVYHTTAPGDPLFVRDARGVTHRIYVAPSGVHCHFPLWSSADAYIYFARGIPPDDWDIWRIHPTGAGLERITFHDSRVSHPVLLDERTLVYLWSPDGQFLIYSGADVGTTFPLRAVARDGRPYPIPAMILTRGARRVAFFRDAHSIVLLRGDVGHKNFWLVDLRTGAERQITELAPDIAIGDFDLSRDGSGVLFDRAQESSRIALIERGG